MRTCLTCFWHQERLAICQVSQSDEFAGKWGARGGWWVELRNVVDLRYGSALTILKKNLPVKYRNELNHGSIELVRVRVSVKCEGKLRLLLWNKRKSVFVQKIKESHR